MVVPESSHDRSCSKESPKNVPSTITIPESVHATAQLHKDRTRIARGLGHAVVHAIHLDRGIHKECTMHAQGTHKDTHKDFETSACVVISGATDLRPSHITQDHAQGNGTRTHAQGPHKVAKSLHKDPHKENCTSTFLDISLCSLNFFLCNTVLVLGIRYWNQVLESLFMASISSLFLKGMR